MFKRTSRLGLGGLYPISQCGWMSGSIGWWVGGTILRESRSRMYVGTPYQNSLDTKFSCRTFKKKTIHVNCGIRNTFDLGFVSLNV